MRQCRQPLGPSFAAWLVAALGLAASAGALALPDADCANAFVLARTERLKLHDSGQIEAYVIPRGASTPERHHAATMLAPSAHAVFLCDRDLLATVEWHHYMKPPQLLIIEETAPTVGGQLAHWRKWLGLQRKVYMTDPAQGGLETLRYRSGYLEVHDNRIRRLDRDKVPAGWDLRPSDDPFRPSDMGNFEGEPVIAVTRWRRFDLDTRKVVADVPVSTTCGMPHLGTDRATVHCGMNIYEINLDDGSRRRLLGASERRRWTAKPESGGYSGPWVVGKRMLRAYHDQPEHGREIPVALVESIERTDAIPGREEEAARFPSPKIGHAQVVRDRLLLISLAERMAWSFDPAARTFTPYALALSEGATDISAISYTRDYLLIAEVLPPRGGQSAARLLILDSDLRLVHRLDVDGRIDSITTTERPWPAKDSSDGMRLVYRR